jgi:hypothetical protein
MSTKQEQKRKERVAQKDENFQMPIELLQPWSTFVMKTRLPMPIFDKMIAITDEIVDNAENEKSHGEFLAGQIKDELWVDHEILERENLMGFFQDVVRNFVIQQTCQMEPFDRKRIVEEEWYTQLLSMWVISQKDNEYNPCHIHTECAVSAVMYLKIPKYLPTRKSHREDDGAINFTNNAGKDVYWGSPTMTLQPRVGDFFIFPASQQHFVYPFRTEDGEGERRSVSFNAVFSSKLEQDKLKKQKEGSHNDQL